MGTLHKKVTGRPKCISIEGIIQGATTSGDQTEFTLDGRTEKYTIVSPIRISSGEKVNVHLTDFKLGKYGNVAGLEILSRGYSFCVEGYEF